MNITMKYIRSVTNENGNVEATFEVENYKDRTQIKSIEKDKQYRTSLTPVKSSRTAEQNNLMWALIHEIADEENGVANTENEWDVYLRALEKAGAKYEYIACLPEAESILLSQFRAIRKMNSFEHNNRIFNQYKVFYGSSKMDKEEMSKLLEVVLDMAAEYGIYPLETRI